MKRKATLLMALLAFVATVRAQNVTTLDVTSLVGNSYPGTASEPGTIESQANTKILTIGGTSYSAYDYDYEYDPMTGDNSYDENDPFVFSYPISTSLTTGTIDLNSNILTCTQCDYHSVPVEYTDFEQNQYSFSFANQPLGQPINVTDADDDYNLSYLIEIPAPGLTLTSAPANYCSGDQVVFSTAINWPNTFGITYQYQYMVPGGSWQPLAQTTNTTLSFSPLSIPALASYLDQQPTSTSVLFRVYGFTGNFTGVPSSAQSISFAPGPPVAGSVSTTNACSSGTGGTITVTGITGSGNYRWVLRHGNLTTGCDPTVTPSNCTLVENQGQVNSSTLMITDVPPDTYTLLITNFGGSAGACYDAVGLTVNAIPALTLSGGTQTNVSCPGGSDGSVTLTVTGGDAASLVYQLFAGGTMVRQQSTPVFSGLAAGTYQEKAVDACGAPVGQTFTLTQPTRVTGSYTVTNTTCGSPGNGSIVTNVAQGSGTYNYYLYLGGALIGSLPSSTQTSWEIDGLAAGAYSLQVDDAAAPSCSGYMTTIMVSAPPALGLSIVQQVDPSCNGAATGSLVLAGSGGTGSYVYVLTDQGSGQNYNNASGSFTGLPAGSYTAVVQSAVTGCGDAYTYPQPVVLGQPAAIAVALTPTDVRCYGGQNGSVAATVTGGTGSLNLVWQQQNAGLWTAMSPGSSGPGPVVNADGTVLSGLTPGVYRLSVTDANGCGMAASPVTLNEPAVMTLVSAGLSDIVCYGGSGAMNPQITGGNGGNTYSYSTDGGSNYTVFTPGSPLGAGSYLLRVVDSKGCEVDGAAGSITPPPSALAMTDILSDYNGYQISCYGAANGTVTVAAGGGNGAAYSGYVYSVDGEAYGSSPVLSGLEAGVHMIRVMDGRGCVVQQNETLVQPANALSLALAGKQDNNCVDGQDGMLEITAGGGAAPYTFSKDGTNYQTSGTFTGLSSGDYSITAVDVNGCRLVQGYSVVSLYPAIVATPTVHAVTCHGGDDGSIGVEVTGGFGGYSYQWSGPGATAVYSVSSATALSAGTYIARITDDKGCAIGDTILVSEPAALQAIATVRPVCSDATGGRVFLSATGGTPPYQYTVDGRHYQPDSAFVDLPAGSYTLGVTDGHGCSWSQTATITTNPLVPAVDFLVSTDQDALDTLQAEDISAPKPDSVQWSFAPSTVLLGSDSSGPLIQYAQAGSYPATMTAWYGGCDFSITEPIVIGAYDSSAYSAPVLAGLSIDSASITPNPNTGVFNLYIKLYKEQRVMLNLMTASGQAVWSKEWSGQVLITEQESLPSSVAAGVYIAELVTESDVRDFTIIITNR